MDNRSIDPLKSIEQQVFTIEQDKDYKSMRFTPEAILLCSKKLDTADEFQAVFDAARNKKMTLTNTCSIPYTDIKHVSNQSGSKTMDVKYHKMKLLFPGDFVFANGETDIHNIFVYLEKVQGFRPTERQLSPWKAALPNFVYIFVSIGIGAFFYAMASGALTPTLDSNGRGQGKSMFFFEIAQMLGTTGSLLLGLAATGIASWLFWKKFQNPPMETRLEA